MRRASQHHAVCDRREPRPEIFTAGQVDSATASRGQSICRAIVHCCYRTFSPYFCVAGGTMLFMRRYSTSWP